MGYKSPIQECHAVEERSMHLHTHLASPRLAPFWSTWQRTIATKEEMERTSSDSLISFSSFFGLSPHRPDHSQEHWVLPWLTVIKIPPLQYSEDKKTTDATEKRTMSKLNTPTKNKDLGRKPVLYDTHKNSFVKRKWNVGETTGTLPEEKKASLLSSIYQSFDRSFFTFFAHLSIIQVLSVLATFGSW